MAKIRKNHTTEFKTKVAVEAIPQQKTINELTTEYGIHATQINLWVMGQKCNLRVFYCA